MIRESVLCARGMQLFLECCSSHLCFHQVSRIQQGYPRVVMVGHPRSAGCRHQDRSFVGFFVIDHHTARVRSWRALHPQEDQAQDGHRIIASDHHRTTVVLCQALTKE